MSYSKDFRKAAVEYKEQGHTFRQLKEAYKISPQRYYEWKKLMGETGSYEPRKVKHRFRKIAPEKLKQAVKERPDAYLYELAELFGCSAQAVFKMLQKLKITYKKDFHILRKVPPKAPGVFK